MEHVRCVHVRRRAQVKSMKKVVAKIDTKAAELDVGESDFEPGNLFSYPYRWYLA